MSCEHAKTLPWKECGKCPKCEEEGLCDLCMFGDLTVPNDQYKGPLHKCPEEITVCGHFLQKGHQIPLIWTFAFNGAEYWCPFCGTSSGCFGGESEKIIWTEGLYHRMKRYKRTFGAYLDAHSALCCAQLMWDGKWIAPRELPAEELKRLKILADTGWQEGVVIL